MANLFGKTIIGIVAACFAHGAVVAQDVNETFNEGIRLIRIGQPEEGLAKLQAVLAADPDNAEAFELVRRTEVEIFQMLLAEGGQYEMIAKSILERARQGRADLSRDEVRIAELVQLAMSSDYSERSAANVELASNHGEFAVPALVQVLADPNLDIEIDHAMISLFYIGHAAVLPLMESVHAQDDQLRRNTAAALVHIKDSRSGIAFARLSNDPSEAVREVAQSGLDALGLPPGADQVSLGTEQAAYYLSANRVRDGHYSQVVWSWKDGGLRYSDVPAPLYHLELAKRRAHGALRIDPTNAEARSLLARAYMAQIASIEEILAADPENESIAGLAGVTGSLRMVAEALGVDTLRKAFEDSLAANQSATAARIAESLGRVEERGALVGSPLVFGLDSADSRVAYASALALTYAAEGGSLPAADSVVEVLGRAVEEEAIRAVLLIDNNPINRQAFAAATANIRGLSGSWSDSAVSGVGQFMSFPNYDVVVVSDSLQDRSPHHVISLLRETSGTTKILLLGTTETAEEDFGDKVDGVVMLEDGAMSGEALMAKIDEVVDALDARRSRATLVAIAAAEALTRLARADVMTAWVGGKLQAQLGRDDEVAIPVAMAIGAGCNENQVPALLERIGDDAASVELRVACANAIGEIVARTRAKPAGMFDQLIALVEDDAQDTELRAAAVNALGKAQLAPGERARLVDVLDVVATGVAEEEF